MARLLAVADTSEKDEVPRVWMSWKGSQRVSIKVFG
jgi:hypothetical protein